MTALKAIEATLRSQGIADVEPILHRVAAWLWKESQPKQSEEALTLACKLAETGLESVGCGTALTRNGASGQPILCRCGQFWLAETREASGPVLCRSCQAGIFEADG